MADGFRGARDASILERYADLITTEEELANGVVKVQCTNTTKDLLHRAGYRRTVLMDNYAVRFVKDWMGRMQIAAAAINLSAGGAS